MPIRTCTFVVLLCLGYAAPLHAAGPHRPIASPADSGASQTLSKTTAQACTSSCATGRGLPSGGLFTGDSIAAAAPGNLSPRFPYETWRLYYYDRPYNASHVHDGITPTVNPDHPDEMQVRAWLPYSNQIFAEAAQKIESRIIDETSSIGYDSANEKKSNDPAWAADGYLEYSDWAKHRRARVAWEELPLPPSPPTKTKGTNHAQIRPARTEPTKSP